MSTVLITGASGFIGRALAAAMSEHHNVLCMSRKNPDLTVPWIRAVSALLRICDSSTNIADIVIHLAAVIGGCQERDGILVNVEGTRCLMRYSMDRGRTPLHAAVNGERPEMVRYLLENGADPFVRENNWDDTPKGWARWSGNEEVIEILREAAQAE